MPSASELQALGVSADTTKRLSPKELLLTGKYVAPYLTADEQCIMQAVLGGAYENSDVHFWQSDALTAQTYCNCKVTFDDACDHLAKASQGLADFLRAKGKNVKDKTIAQDDKTASEPVTNAVTELGDAAGRGASNVIDTVAHPIDNAVKPLVVVVGVVVLVAAVAVGIALAVKQKAGV